MRENFITLGIFIIISFFFCLLVDCLLNGKYCIKKFEDDILKIENGFSLIMAFIMMIEMSALILMQCYVGISKKFSGPFVESGCLFVMLQMVFGNGVRKIYDIIFSIVAKIFKIERYYKLNSAEIDWTWLLACFVSGAMFLFYDERLTAFTYFSIDLGYFLSINSDIKSIKEKIFSIKQLTKAYWCCIIVIAIISTIQGMTKSNDQFLCVLIGMSLGALFKIICIDKNGDKQYKGFEKMKKWIKRVETKIYEYWDSLSLVGALTIKGIDYFLKFSEESVLYEILTFLDVIGTAFIAIWVFWFFSEKLQSKCDELYEKAQHIKIVPKLKENIYCNWLIISIIIIVMGVIMDIVAALRGIELLEVKESYMDYLFAAIISVGLLSFSIIALISGFLQEKFYGYKLRELLTFKGIKKRINLRTYITTSLIQIILGIILLSLCCKVSCIGTMISLLISSIFLAWCMAQTVLDIMVNNEVIYKTLENGYENFIKDDINKSGRISYHINTLKNAVIENCKNHNLEETEEICTLYSILLREIDRKDDTRLGEFVRTSLEEVVYNISMEFGYFKMIEQITKMFEDVSQYAYWKRNLYLKSINEIKYFNSRQLKENDYQYQILNLHTLEEYKEGKITNSEHKEILYKYFDALIKNELATYETKYQLLKEYFNELFRFYRNCDDGKLLAEEEVALDILKYILNTDNVEEQEALYKLFVRSMFVNNQYRKDTHYFLFLSVVFQLIYYYAYLEKEVRTEEYRKRIRKLVDIEIKDDTISRLRVTLLLRRNLEGMLKSFRYRIPDDIFQRGELDAHINFPVAKQTIWTKEFNIKFFFMLYYQYYNLVGRFHKLSDFLHWDKLPFEKKDYILKELDKFFDKINENILLNKSFVESCKELGELYGNNGDINSEDQRSIYDWIQKEREKLVDQKLEEFKFNKKESLDIKKIDEYLDNMMQKDEICWWKSDDTTMNFYKKYSGLRSSMEYLYNSKINHEKTVADFIKKCGQIAFDELIRSESSKLNISYDDDGINKVLKLIESDNYLMRNFSYVSDWKLMQYKELESYKQLVEKEKAIELSETVGIYQDIFSKNKKISGKIIVSNAERKPITEEECLHTLEKCGKYKGYYYVDGILRDKKKAIESIKKRCYTYEFDFELYIDFDPKDITWFCYDDSNN